MKGQYEVIDLITGLPIETDPINRMEGDTPLHCAVRWINEGGPERWEEGKALIELMLESVPDARYVVMSCNRDMVEWG